MRYDDEFQVATGEFLVRSRGVILAYGIGSCGVVCMLHKGTRRGGLAHIMLPGSHPGRDNNQLLYASNNIGRMVDKLGQLGSKESELIVTLTGCANVLKREEDTIFRDVEDSIREILDSRGLSLAASVTGGETSRSVRMDVGKQEVWYREVIGAWVRQYPA